MSRLANRCLVVLFLLLLAAPLGANLWGHDGGDGPAENRTLAAWPVLEPTWESVSTFGTGFDLWFQDHFGFRSTLVRWYGASRYFGLGMSPTPMVIRGKDDWLFYHEDGGIEDITNEQLLTPAEIANWRSAILRTRDWCRARGIPYLFTIPPDKHIVYAERLPDTIRPQSSRTRTDQLLAAVQDTGVVVDVRRAIFAAKAQERVYHVTDTHWNDRGAYAAYQEIINAVRRSLPSVPPPHDRSTFDATSRMLDGRDLAATMGLKWALHEEDLRLLPKAGRGYKVLEPAGGYATGGDGRIVTEIPGSSLPRAVVFRDSFFSALAPLLSEHFSRVVYYWQNDFDAAAVAQEQPDIVIQEIVGRHLHAFVPSPELVPDP